MSMKEREDALKKYLFRCECKYCNTIDMESDKRRMRLRVLDDCLFDVGKKDPNKALLYVNEIIEIQKIEGIINQTLIIRAYNDLLQFNLILGQCEKSKIVEILNKILQLQTEIDGFDSSEVIKHK